MLEQKIILIAAGILLLLLLMMIMIMGITIEKQQETCEHKNTFTYVDSVVVTCETTTVTCLDCGKKLKTETDCR